MTKKQETPSTKNKGSKSLSVTKMDNFSEWYSEVIQKAELADLRYNVKGFLVFQPWSVLAMEKMYDHLERALQKKGHKPHFFPTVIPEENLTKESTHIKGFTPEVFWITQAGDKRIDEKLALRPTSETAFYQMFSLWIRSYKDLPFKTYQRANVFRYETKATRPFLRSREFHWIETHCVFPTQEAAENQVHEDMQTTQEVLHDIFGLPFMFFERPAWDKFPGALRTFAADVLNPDGRVVQQPSTHMISQNFSKAFNVTFRDKDGKDKTPFMTCYGPAVSRIFASIIITHGDDKGLKFPWNIAPKHIVIAPLSKDEKLLAKAEALKEKLSEYDVEIDLTDKSPGEKFNYWELKGVPIRIDLGMKELEDKKLSVFRRDLDKKEVILEKDVLKYVEQVKKESTINLIKKADTTFTHRVKDAKSFAELGKIINAGSIARATFCSVESDATSCAERIEKEIGARVRGRKLEKETASGNCIVCGEKAKEIVYIARDY